jgi:hypothetical protein
MVQHIIQFNLSGRQVQEICERGDDDSTPDVMTTAPHIRRFVMSMQKVKESEEDEFVQGLLHQEQSPVLARARIDTTIAFLLRVKKRLPED